VQLDKYARIKQKMALPQYCPRKGLILPRDRLYFATSGQQCPDCEVIVAKFEIAKLTDPEDTK
jgi:hypothetical protein